MNRLLEIQNLSKRFQVAKKITERTKEYVHALNDVSLHINRSETLALVGESGSGKSTLGRCIVKLYNADNGSIVFEGQDITNYNEKQMLPVRRQVQMVFQDPYSSLNPRMDIRTIIGEALWDHKLVADKSEYNKKIENIADMCGIALGALDRYPHQFSGGQRQRIGLMFNHDIVLSLKVHQKLAFREYLLCCGVVLVKTVYIGGTKSWDEFD